MTSTDVMLRIFQHLSANGGVLAYHGVIDPVTSPAMHVSPGQLAIQLEFLRARYRVIPLWELLGRIEKGRSIAGYVAITFDDAYQGVGRHALPLLQALDLPATCFVTIDAARDADHYRYWWDVVDAVRLSEDGSAWRQVLDGLGISELPLAPDAQDVLRRHVLESRHGRWPSKEPSLRARVDSDLSPMSVEALRTLAADSRIEFGCHTVTHPALPMLTAADQVQEIAECDRQLREWLPGVRPVIAYPYGLVDRTTISAARTAGMRYGLSIEGFAPARRENAMTIPRLGVGERLTPRGISLRLSRAVRPLLIARHGRVHAA